MDMATNAAENPELVITGAQCMGWISRSITVMRRRRDEINSLNVFPVPDSDTGSNMLATLSAAYESAQHARQQQGDSAQVITAALAAGAVRGARGNSGTVLSQVFRALAESTTAEGISAKAVETSLKRAVQHVSSAIANPVEGTILTVLRHAASAAEHGEGDDVQVVVKRVADAAREALARTPSQLKVLRDAGVVDAGGAGLVLLLDALVLQLAGIDTEEAPSPELYVEARDVPEMEVMYLISLDDEASRDQLRERLEQLGNSLIVAGEPGSNTFMVHIHTFDPGAAIEASFDFGRPMGIRLEVLDDATEYTSESEPEEVASSRMIIAVVPKGPLAELFTSAGAIAVPQETAVDSIIEAIQSSAEGTEIVLLPNGLIGQNEIVRVEVSVGAGKRTVTNIPTTSLVAGLAALAVHDAQYPLPIDAFAMSEAATGIRFAELITADSARLTSVGPCSKGDVLTLVDGSVVAVTDTVGEAVSATVRTMLATHGGELVTLLLGDGVDPGCAGTLRDELAKKNLDVDVIAYAAQGMTQLVQVGVE